jgi:hypothetical protein
MPSPLPSPPVRLLVGTWNVGNARPKEDFSPWLPRHGEGFDVIAVGLQESTYTSAGAHEEEEEDEDDADDATPGSPSASASASAGAPEHHHSALDTLKAGVIGASRRIGHAAGAVAAGVQDAAHHSLSENLSRAQGAAQSVAQHAVHKGAALVRDPASVTAAMGAAAASAASHASVVTAMVKAHLGEEFECVVGLLMFQLGLLVFVRRAAALRVDEVETRCEGTGLMGIAPNKGGCAARLRVTREGAAAGGGEGARLAFVSAHLAAHMKHAAAREDHAVQVLGNIRLGPEPMLDIDVQHDHCFVFGDLNFRVDLAIKRAGQRNVDNEARFGEVQALLAAGDRAALLASDQLRDAVRHGRALAGFADAAEPAFAPTFKVERQPGFRYKSTRVSSWCDRVLVKSLPSLRGDVRCTGYEAHGAIATSDHKPVSAAFEVSLRVPRPHAAPFSATEPVDYIVAPVARLRHLAGEGLLGLDLSGKSDPFVVVFSDRGEGALRGAGRSLGPPKTRVLPQTTTPRWPLLEFKIAAAAPADLDASHLFLCLMDADSVRSERMGQAVLPLAAAARAGGAEVPFELAVTRGGRACGTLSGTLQLQWPVGGAHIILAPDQGADARGGGDCAVA